MTKELVFTKKKIISDIRLYKSESQNEYGGYVTVSFGDKKLNAIVKRVVMKLRENEFSLGEFDHLYINFTTCDMTEEMNLSDKVDNYHPWYRYCSVHIEKNLYNKLGSLETWNDIIQWMSNILVTYFASEDFDKERIFSCVQQAVNQGEDMLMKFKEKTIANRKVAIFLRFRDTCMFYPLLRIYDIEGNLLFEKDLPEAATLDYLGDIKVSTKRVAISPRKNAFTRQMTSLIFEY